MLRLGHRSRETKYRMSSVGFAVILQLIALTGVLALGLGIPSLAFADEDNLVNPQQLPDSSFIYDTSILDLSTADAYFNDQTVQVTGEVIGDNIRAESEGSYRWITLISQDPKTNATIPILMSLSDTGKIDTYGKYGVEGTMLRVQGTYHLTCPDHEGLSDIHADRVSLVQRGMQSPDTFTLELFIPGVAAVVVGLIMLAVFYRIRERRR